MHRHVCGIIALLCSATKASAQGAPYGCPAGTECPDGIDCSAAWDCAACDIGEVSLGIEPCVKCEEQGKVANEQQSVCESCSAGKQPNVARSGCEEAAPTPGTCGADFVCTAEATNTKAKPAATVTADTVGTAAECCTAPVADGDCVGAGCTVTKDTPCPASIARRVALPLHRSICRSICRHPIGIPHSAGCGAERGEAR